MTGSAVNEVLSEDEIHVEFIVLYQNLVLEKLPCATKTQRCLGNCAKLTTICRL